MKDIVTLYEIQKQLEHQVLICWKWLKQARSQNDDIESKSLLNWAQKIDCHASFVEFGFSVYEYNSVALTKAGFKGLLLDASGDSCKEANQIFSRLELNTMAKEAWISLDSLSDIIDFYNQNSEQLGVLNIDIDGNDYWILKALLENIKPEIICVEHNASFGLRSVSTPYLADFNRHAHHSSGLYHGASIIAFEKLLSNSYRLVENIAGLNLIFIRSDKIDNRPDIKILQGQYSLLEPALRNKWSKSTTLEQWEIIKHLPFVEV